MLRGCAGLSRLLLAFSTASLLAASASANPILIDDYPGTDLSLIGGGVTVIFNSGGAFNLTGGAFDFVGGNDVALNYLLNEPIDLTDSGSNTGIAITGLFLIPPSGPVDLSVTLASGSDEVSASLLGLSFSPPDDPGPHPLTLHFVDFSGDAGFDISQVDQLTFAFTKATLGGFAVSLDRIQVQLVPEPSTAMLLGLGLVGLYAAGRRQVAQRSGGPTRLA